MVDEESSSTLLFAGMDTNSAQNGREEIVTSVELESQTVIFSNDRCNVLGGTGVNRAGILTPDIFFKPFLVGDLDAKAIGKSLVHGILNLKIFMRLETPERKSLSLLK